uniref:hypothetical protein n=1 Tax=Salmonella sp. TaxID=599 RepID=UPI00399217F4
MEAIIGGCCLLVSADGEEIERKKQRNLINVALIISLSHFGNEITATIHPFTTGNWKLVSVLVA